MAVYTQHGSDNKMKKKQIYLDHGASTPVHPQVIEAMLPFWTDAYGNPASNHEHGRIAHTALDNARRTFANLMHAQPDEFVFTGCGSESDNLALRGVLWAAKAQGQTPHLITSCIEHKAILETAVQLQAQMGLEVTVLPVDEYGRISLTDLREAIQPNTALISIMAANNEIGTIQPFLQIGEIAREHNIHFHTDAVQAVSTTEWNLQEMPIDLLSIAPHKFYGPKGVGVLYVRDGIQLTPFLTGGGQEEGRRAGTVNVPFAVGAAKAFELAQAEMAHHIAHYTILRNQLINGILAQLPDDECVLTGHPEDRLPHHVSFAFRNVNGNDLLIHLDMAGISASSGSACKTGNPKPSAILEAIGLSKEWTTGGLRLTVGTQTSAEDIEYVIKTIPAVVAKVKKMNALFA